MLFLPVFAFAVLPGSFRARFLTASGSVLAVCILLAQIIFPFAGVTPGSLREALSIPAQQVARCVVEHGEGISPQQRSIIERVFSYNAMKNDYDPSLSDRVKNTFNKYATSDDVSAFLGVWGELFRTYPLTCVAATVANYYGWFYPTESHGNYSYKTSVEQRKAITENSRGEIDIHNSSSRLSEALGDATDEYFELWDSNFPLSVLTQGCTWVWMLLLLLVFCLRRYKLLVAVLLLPLLVLCVTLTGPCNFVVRYLFPVAFVLPFFLSVAVFGYTTTECCDACAAKAHTDG